MMIGIGLPEVMTLVNVKRGASRKTSIFGYNIVGYLASEEEMEATKAARAIGR